jgi:hypothetical protein
MDGKMGPLFPKVVPYEKQARLRLFGGGVRVQKKGFGKGNQELLFFEYKVIQK